MPQRRGRVKEPAASESRINEERHTEHKQGETAAGLRAALIGAVLPRRPFRCRAAKAFTRITTAVQPLDSLAAAPAHSHCICTTVARRAAGAAPMLRATEPTALLL